MCDFEVRSVARAIVPDQQKETPTSQVGASENSKRQSDDAMIDQNPPAALTRIKRLTVFDARRKHLARAQYAVHMLHAEEMAIGEALATGAINAAMGPDLRILSAAQDVIDVMAAINDGEVAS